MSELKNCPFCGGAATVGANEYYDGANTFYIYCASCGVQQMTTKIRTDEAIAAWNRRADVADTNSGNKPLTLDELKQMDGEPVWTVTNGVEGSGRWEILESVDNEFMRLCNPVDTTYDCPIDTYGKTWLAYRTKPEGSDT